MAHERVSNPAHNPVLMQPTWHELNLGVDPEVAKDLGYEVPVTYLRPTDATENPTKVLIEGDEDLTREWEEQKRLALQARAQQLAAKAMSGARPTIAEARKNARREEALHRQRVSKQRVPR